MSGAIQQHLASRLREAVENWTERLGRALGKHADAGFVAQANVHPSRQRKGGS